MRLAYALLIWVGLALAITVPLSLAATSEYLAWRDPVYIAAGFAGVLALCIALEVARLQIGLRLIKVSSSAPQIAAPRRPRH
jgi:hypothetical protein